MYCEFGKSSSHSLILEEFDFFVPLQGHYWMMQIRAAEKMEEPVALGL